MTTKAGAADGGRLVAELGPVDYVVVEFPRGSPDVVERMAEQLGALVDRHLIDVYDLVLIDKDEDGRWTATELSDLPNPANPLRHLEPKVARLLAASDVANLASTIRPTSTAVVVVWENTWAVPFAASIRRDGGQLVATGRIPIAAIVASLADDPEER